MENLFGFFCHNCKLPSHSSLSNVSSSVQHSSKALEHTTALTSTIPYFLVPYCRLPPKRFQSVELYQVSGPTQSVQIDFIHRCFIVADTPTLKITLDGLCLITFMPMMTVFNQIRWTSPMKGWQRHRRMAATCLRLIEKFKNSRAPSYDVLLAGQKGSQLPLTAKVARKHFYIHNGGWYFSILRRQAMAS